MPNKESFDPLLSGTAVIVAGFFLAISILLALTTGLGDVLKTQVQNTALPTFNASAECMLETQRAHLDCVPKKSVNEDDPEPDPAIKEACDRRYAKTCQKCLDAFGGPAPKGTSGEIFCRNLIQAQATETP